MFPVLVELFPEYHTVCVCEKQEEASGGGRGHGAVEEPDDVSKCWTVFKDHTEIISPFLHGLWSELKSLTHPSQYPVRTRL